MIDKIEDSFMGGVLYSIAAFFFHKKMGQKLTLR